MIKKDILKKTLDTVGFIQGKILLVLTIVVPLLVTIQVILRYGLHAPLMGIEELMLFPTIWLYMLGGSNASRERNHISCGILSLYINSAKGMAIFNSVRTVISSVISCWLTYWALWYFMYSLRMWKTSDLLYIPMFLGESSIFIGLFLMTIYTIIETVDTVLSAIGVFKKSDNEGMVDLNVNTGTN